MLQQAFRTDQPFAGSLSWARTQAKRSSHLGDCDNRSVLREHFELWVGEIRTIGAGRRAVDRVRIARALWHAHANHGRGRRLFGWLPNGSDPPKDITLRSGVSLLVRRADAISLFEQFGLDIYGLDILDREVRDIVDLGANVGFATIVLAARYPRAQFVCVEPAHDTCELLRENLARNGIQAQIADAAIVGKPGLVSINPGAHPGVSRIERTSGAQIEGLTIAGLLDRVGVEHVDLLKIDVEGAEREVFENAADWAGRVDAIIGEIHGDLTHERVNELLGAHGFAPLSARSPRGYLSDQICLTRQR